MADDFGKSLDVQGDATADNGATDYNADSEDGVVTQFSEDSCNLKDDGADNLPDGEDNSSHYYERTPLSDESVSAVSGGQCFGYGSGESHRGIIESAGGELNDDFYDPRSGQNGKMTADRFFINQDMNEINGINFTKNGEYCCSYTGVNYQDIKDSNIRDCKSK